MFVADVASAVVAALQDDGSSMGKLYELGGPDVYTLRQLVILNSIVSIVLPQFIFHVQVHFFNHKVLISMFRRLKLCMK